METFQDYFWIKRREKCIIIEIMLDKIYNIATL